MCHVDGFVTIGDKYCDGVVDITEHRSVFYCIYCS